MKMPKRTSFQGKSFIVALGACVFVLTAGLLLYYFGSNNLPGRDEVAFASTEMSPVLTYEFDESTGETVVDTSGSGNNGVLVGSPIRVEGKFGQALEFNNLESNPSMVNAGSGDSLDNMSQQDYSVEAWVKITTVPSQSGSFGIANKMVGGKKQSKGWWFNINYNSTNNAYDLNYYDTTTKGTRRVYSVATVPVEMSKWHHIAMVYTNTDNKARLFFDGAEVVYSTQEVKKGNPANDSPADLVIGYFSGLNSTHQIDAMQIYNYARSADQIARDARVVTVREFGARGDGVTEDQVAFQAAVDYLKLKGGGRLFIPAGTYILHKTTTGWNGTFNIIDARDIEMYGAGNTVSILKRKDVTPIGDTHIVRIIGSDTISLHDFGIDGSRETGNQDQMHGVYVLNSNNITLEGLNITRVRGSGTYLIGGNDVFCSTPPCKTTNVTIANNTFDDNYRAGSANQGGIENITYSGNTYSNTGPGQAIDFEPSGTRPGAKNVSVTNNNLGSSGGSAILTLAGTSIVATNFVVTDNVMTGGVLTGRMDGLTFARNRVVAGNARSLDIRGNVTNATFTDNHLESDGVEAIHLAASNISNIDISNNNIYQLSSTPLPNTHAGIYSEGVGEHDFKVTNNNFIGPDNSSTPVWGVVFRNLASDGLTRSNFDISGNKFWRMPNQISLTTRDVNSKYENVNISENIYYDNTGSEFNIRFDPSDPLSYIINLTVENNTVQNEIPSP